MPLTERSLRHPQPAAAEGATMIRRVHVMSYGSLEEKSRVALW